MDSLGIETERKILLKYSNYYGIDITPKTYLSAWIVNFIAALPLNFLIVGPIARFILSSFQKPFAGEEEVEDFQDDDEIPTII